MKKRKKRKNRKNAKTRAITGFVAILCIWHKKAQKKIDIKKNAKTRAITGFVRLAQKSTNEFFREMGIFEKFVKFDRIF